MNTVLTVVGGILGAYVLLALTPLGQRLRFWSVTRAGDPGLVLHVEADPSKVPRDDSTLMMFAKVFFLPVEGITPETAPTPPDDGHSPLWWRWAHDLGAFECTTGALLVTIQCLQEGAVVVDSPVVHHTHSPAPPGVTLSPAGMGAGGVDPRIYYIRLDGPVAEVEYMDDQGRPPSFKLENNDTERLLISVLCQGPWKYDWWLELPVIANGKRRTYTIDDHGKPFTTVGEPGQRTLMWHSGTWYDR